MTEEQDPGDALIKESLKEYRIIEVDAQQKALELGDRSGRTANVVMMGILSTLPPFNVFPEEYWLKALQKACEASSKGAGSKPAVWAANYAAFRAGRQYPTAVTVQG
jgi:indolepyruvate ferredoxin oxidoreductase alpha subunit